ncbi:MAG TPA: hypothetical protein VK494_07980 [Gemmatimonadaceae bacterium]|jgi:hypothetical protein|nr:hypothetical protein [Gemmatimonadaceae bacterium]
MPQAQGANLYLLSALDTTPSNVPLPHSCTLALPAEARVLGVRRPGSRVIHTRSSVIDASFPESELRAPIFCRA